MPTLDEVLLQAWQIHQQGNAKYAEQIYRSALQQQPEHANAWCYLGIALHDQKKYADSVLAYQNALHHNPIFPIALNNLGNSLRYLGRVEEADAAFQRAIELDPKYFNAYRNRGTLHAWTGRVDRAFQHYYEAMKLNPADAELHRNLGVIHLLQGNFAEGWAEYRYRWKCPDAIQHQYAKPKWNGQSLDGKTILLYSEQGLGDTIQFVRFAKVLKERGASTIVYAQHQLLALLQGCQGIDVLVPNSLPLEYPFDYHCSLMDVADMLQIDLESIPSEVPYIVPRQNLIQYWSVTLGKLLPPARLRIGLHWQGNPDHQADMFRSFPLNEFAPIADLEGVQLISLQRGRGTEQIAKWAGSKPIHTLPENVDQSSGAFMDTAAILAQLDLIVTNDTSVAHLAGALARPFYMILGYTPDWRWLQQRLDTPWYPTATLFRQSKIGHWSDAIESVVRAIDRNYLQAGPP